MAEPTWSAAVAAEIRAEMARQRRTTTDVAAEIGISAAALGRRLRGEYPLAVTELDQIMQVLGVKVEDLWVRAMKRDGVAS